MANLSIKKAIFPVAGIGSRFLPATKATPKEMLPIVDKPLIQYAVEEAVNAGITELIFVTNYNKRTIEDHFDRNIELERSLEQAGKLEVLATVKQIIPPNVTFIYIRQMQPFGLGHAVWCAKNVIGNEPFAVLLADDLITTTNQNSCLKQMVEKYNQVKSSIIAVEHCEPELVFNYGIVGVDQKFNNFGKINNIVEKPKPKDALSNLAVIGRYILSANIFNYLDDAHKQFNNTIGTGFEMQLTPAISSLLSIEDVYALDFDGVRYDCGQKLGYLQATVAMALKHPIIKQDFKKFLTSIL
ncbi:MAG: UTP--glucose-1-phosphate uridylyltransferase GalU [Gammaproteobacteria bacterium]|jgi:UTP--glucose-1-phosphate uridylyltransferase